VYFQNLAFPHYLAPFTMFTSVLRVDVFTPSFALGTNRLHLLNKTWPQLLCMNLHSTSTACFALLNCSFFAATACKKGKLQWCSLLFYTVALINYSCASYVNIKISYRRQLRSNSLPALLSGASSTKLSIIHELDCLMYHIRGYNSASANKKLALPIQQQDIPKSVSVSSRIPIY
jgi:hypothetical protein